MYRSLHKGVIEVEHKLTRDEAQEIAGLPDIHTLQFAAALEWQSYHYIQEFLLPKLPQLNIRAYHFHDQVCDLAFLEQLPDLRRFEVLCHGEFANLDQLGSLHQLDELSLNLYKLDSFDVLHKLAPGLTSLTLGQTASKKPSLEGISRFTHLRELRIEGHRKHIEELARITHLERLSLRYLTLPNLDFLRSLEELWSLQVYLGGTNDLSVLAELKQLKYLDLSQIRGLKGLDFVSSMTGLQFLRITALPHIHELPAFDQLHELRKIELSNMKGLQKLDSLQDAPTLTEYVHREAWEREPDHYIPLLQNPSLKRAYVHLRNEKKATQFQQLLDKYDKKDASTEQIAHRTSWLGKEFPFES